MAKRFHRPFRKLRELLPTPSTKATASTRAAPPAAAPPAAQPVEGAPPVAPTTFSELAHQTGIARAAHPTRVAPPQDARPLALPPISLSHHAFVVNIDGERVEARRDDTEAVVLPWLERQDPTATLDLHGHQAEAARRQLHRFLRARSARRHRVVLVITGRGQQSGGVLRANTPEWLTEPSIGEVVRAFVSAPPSFGGAGALLVLLHTKPPT